MERLINKNPTNNSVGFNPYTELATCTRQRVRRCKDIFWGRNHTWQALSKWFTDILNVTRPLSTLGLTYFPSTLQASFTLALSCYVFPAYTMQKYLGYFRFLLKIRTTDIHICTPFFLTKASFCKFCISLLLNVLVHQIQQQNMKGKEVFLVTPFLLPSSIYKERSTVHSCPGFQ